MNRLLQAVGTFWFELVALHIRANCQPQNDYTKFQSRRRVAISNGEGELKEWLEEEQWEMPILTITEQG